MLLVRNYFWEKKKKKRKSFWDDTYCWKFLLYASKQNICVIYLFISALHPPKLQLFNFEPAHAAQLPVETFCPYSILKINLWYERLLKSQLCPSGNEFSSSSWHNLRFWEENPGPVGIVHHAWSGNLTKRLWQDWYIHGKQICALNKFCPLHPVPVQSVLPKLIFCQCNCA